MQHIGVHFGLAHAWPRRGDQRLGHGFGKLGRFSNTCDLLAALDHAGLLDEPAGVNEARALEARSDAGELLVGHGLRNDPRTRLAESDHTDSGLGKLATAKGLNDVVGGRLTGTYVPDPTAGERSPLGHVMGKTGPDHRLAVERKEDATRRHAAGQVAVVCERRLPFGLVPPHEQAIEPRHVHAPAHLMPAAVPFRLRQVRPLFAPRRT